MGQVVGAALRLRTSTLVSSSLCLLSAHGTINDRTHTTLSLTLDKGFQLGSVAGAALRKRNSTLVISSPCLLLASTIYPQKQTGL